MKDLPAGVKGPRSLWSQRETPETSGDSWHFLVAHSLLYRYAYIDMVWWYDHPQNEKGDNSKSPRNLFCVTHFLLKTGMFGIGADLLGTWCPAANRGYMELPATPLPAAHNVVGEVGEGNCSILLGWNIPIWGFPKMVVPPNHPF